MECRRGQTLCVLLSLTQIMSASQGGQSESLGDYARRVRASRVAEIIKQLEPLNDKQLSKLFLKDEGLDIEFQGRSDWERTLYLGKQALVTAFHESAQIKERCQAGKSTGSTECQKGLAEAEEAWSRAKANFLDTVVVGEAKAAKAKEGARPGTTAGADEAEMIRRAKQARAWEELGGPPREPGGSSPTLTAAQPDYVAAYSTDTGPGAVYSWTPLPDGDLISDWKAARIFEVYGGKISFADSILASGTGVIKSICVMIVNSTSDTWSVKFTVRCGAWATTDSVERLEPKTTLKGPATVKRYNWAGRLSYDFNALVYAPDVACNSVTLDVYRRDLERRGP